ncbi:hypothetical protein AB0L25_05840 [Spirillospora sp. NPDC052242]
MNKYFPHSRAKCYRTSLTGAEFAREANVDASWLEPMYDLVRRAVEAGHGEHGISALYEVLKR